jgi:Fe-S-cluster formation regulator IscX/YfhJ
MGRQTSFRKTADILRKTIQQLEADPTIDPNGTAFVDLKCNLLNRIIELETDKARSESVIHLVNSEAAAKSEAQEEQNSDSAIA